MRQNGQLKHMVLLDFRADTLGMPLPFTSSDSNVWVIRICFRESYTKAIIHGLEDQPVVLDVGMGENVIRTTDGISMSCQS